VPRYPNTAYRRVERIHWSASFFRSFILGY
jgi:hypothetical protein